MEFLNGFVCSSNILKGDRRGLFGDKLRPRLSKLHDARTATLHRAQQEPKNQTNQHKGKKQAQKAHKPVRLGHLVSELSHIRVGDSVDNFFATGPHIEELNLFAQSLDTGGQFQINALFAINDGGASHLVVTKQAKTLLGRHLTEPSGSE